MLQNMVGNWRTTQADVPKEKEKLVLKEEQKDKEEEEEEEEDKQELWDMFLAMRYAFSYEICLYLWAMFYFIGY